MNKGIIRDAFLLFIITLIAGFCLGAVHEITLEPIAQAQPASATATYQAVYPEAASVRGRGFPICCRDREMVLTTGPPDGILKPGGPLPPAEKKV